MATIDLTWRESRRGGVLILYVYVFGDSMKKGMVVFEMVVGQEGGNSS